MVYEIQVPPRTDIPSDIDLVYENAKSAKIDFEHLRRLRPGVKFVVLKDGKELTEAQLDADVESCEIQSVREEATRIPPTYRRGRGVESDDVAIGIDGKPAKVWGPDNPEDRFEE
ncbi:MAG: hypothetical protein A3H28_06805 [Acidobacteria bacterium RIFCSPLOWO2_02_FULL_61_28]|nr:MAG: hypothetical protein A3H28_06805 [Acidobacteria bacterium RIFCSPLOWO2_02_FULL_61_28]